MASPIDSPANINSFLAGALRKKPAAPRTSSAAAGGGIADRVDIAGNRSLDFLRVEAGALKNELPGLIAGSLLAPVAESARRQAPINALLTRLVSPADALLQRTAVGGFSRSQLAAFQGEVETLRQSIPRMAANELLAPLLTSGKRTDSLNGILTRISGELTGLADLVLQKMR